MKIVRKLFILITFAFILTVSSLNDAKPNFTQENDQDQCEEKLNMFFSYFMSGNKTQILPVERQREIEYSGKNINDLGDFRSCLLQRNISDYVLLSVRQDIRGYVQLGLCLPFECNANYINDKKQSILGNINTILGTSYNESNIQFINSTEYGLIEKEKDLIPAAITSGIALLLFIFSIISFLIVLNGKRQKKENSENVSLLKESNEVKVTNGSNLFIFQSFDIVTNLSKIFTVNRENSDNNELNIFDGVRTFSNYSVIIAHTFSFLLLFPVKNLFDLVDVIKSFYFSLITCCFYSVDIFFYMSGFFLYLSLYKEKKAKITSIIFYRLVRLLPLYIFVLLASTYIVPFFLNGPSLNAAISYTEPCKLYWWHNLLFINNLIWYEGNNCLGHSWYLANDFQFFLIFICIWFFVMKKSKKAGNYILLFLLLASIVTQLIVVYVNDIFLTNIKQIYTGQDTSKNDFFYIYYIKPWNRITVYIVGIFFAQLYIDKNNTEIVPNEKTNIFRKFNQKIQNSNLFFWSVFCFAFILIAVSMLLMYPYLKYALDWSRLGNAVFVTFGKLIFVIGSALILHLTFYNRLSFIKTIFSFRIFTTVSRVSYAIYLLHAYVIILMFANYPTSVYISPYDMTIMSLAFYTVSAVLSVPATLLFDSPIMGILKGLLRKK